ncbi:MAG: uracil-DNA glycosylase [Deltaproteobacteria bacterium]|nr:uracil-DNA glycosylase [Deltaproteobacteria bacterium]
MNSPAPPPERPAQRNCRLCRHYFITWEASVPHGCRAMGFKSKYLPYIQVFRISGQNCQLFSPRPK